MDSVSNLPDTAAKAPNLAANLLASLSASLASGDSADGLFSNFLSQIQTPPPPAAPPTPPSNQPANTQTNSPPPASQSSQEPAQNTTASDAPDAETTASSPSDTNTPTPPPGRPLIGKSQRHDAKTGTDKNKKDDAANTQPSSPSSPPPVAASNVQAATSSDAPAVATATVAANDPNNNTATDSDPVNAPAPAPDPTQNAKGQTSPAPVAAAPVTDTETSSNGNGDAGGTANNDVTASQLMLMLTQLEHLAAGRAAGVTAAAADPLNAASGQNTNAPATQPAPGASGEAQGKIDLKALLTELAGQNNAGSAGAGPTGQTGDAGTNSNSQNAAAASAGTTATLQNALPASATASPATATDDKWMNASFLNLFNLAANNQNNANVPVIANPGINTDLTVAGTDGAALDTATQDQGGANAHSAAAGSQTLETNIPTAAGPSQAASPYDFASQLSALRAAKGGSTGLPTPVEQVVLQLSRGLSKDGSSQMTIQLRPAELGRVDVKLNIGSDGKVQGTVTADNPATLGLLLKDVRGLERALQEAGLRADSGSLQFNLRGDGQTGGSFGQSSGNPSGSANNTNSPSGSTASLSTLADTAETYYLTPGGVNFRV